MVLLAVGRESPTLPAAPVTSVFYLFRDAPPRRAALELEPGSPARYSLYGMDQLADRGFAVRHNLERSRPSRAARAAGGVLKRGLEAAGGYGGDFETVLASRGRLNRADVVFSTVDTVGIPLMLLARSRIVRPPFVYAAIGLPERLVQLRSHAWSGSMRGHWARHTTIVAYSEHEADVLGGGFGREEWTRGSSSCRSGWTSRRSGRPARLRTSTSSRWAPILTATSSCC